MAKGESILSIIIKLAVWIAGILVALAVGSGMINGILTVKWIPEIVTVSAGWIVVVLTILGVILTLFDR